MSGDTLYYVQVFKKLTDDFSFGLSKTRNMKQWGNKKLIKVAKKAKALFSKLSGPGIVGFCDHKLETNGRKTPSVEDSLTIQNRSLKTLSSCQHQKNCDGRYNCQTGNHHRCYRDLLNYLSGQT